MTTKNLIPRGSGEGGIGITDIVWGYGYYDTGNFNKGLFVSGKNIDEVIADAVTGGGLGGAWNAGAGGIIYYNGGNVGIGTTSPIGTLEVKANPTEVVLRGVSPNGLSIIDIKKTNSGNTEFSNSLYPGGTAGDFIFSNGNVGIGTASPGVKLEVLGASSAIGIDNEIISIQTATANHRLSLGVNSADEYAWIRSSKNGTELPLILSNGGNVGIGTTDPLSRLHVTLGNGQDGSIKAGGDAQSLGLMLEYDQTGDTESTITSNSSVTSNPGALLKIRTCSDVNPNQLVLKGDGNVGIGTTSPGTYKLNVNGNVFASSYTPTSDDRVKHNEQTIVGALETLSKVTPKKYIKTTEMYDANHDFELDADGNPIDEGGEPVEHNIEAGVIAQQVLTVDELAFAVSPEGVDEDGVVTSPHGLDYNSLFTYAIAAIQEQQALIKDLRSEVEALKNK